MASKRVALILLLVTILAIPGACSAGQGSNDIQDFAAVEIREYQGISLSSIADLRDDSTRLDIDLDVYRLKVDGLVKSPVEYTLAEIFGSLGSHQRVASLTCVEGWSVKILWDGVLVEDLIERAEPSPEADTVRFRAYDGYTASLPLDYILERDIMLAGKMNGVALTPELGAPFRVVAEGKLGYEWVKWVTEIELTC